jgi:hypothetical protein
MALVNPNIAMSFRAPEIQPQNMLADYAAAQQIQSGRQAQEMNALKMQEYERARTEEEGLRNYLAQSDLAKPETRAGLVRFGKTGLAYGKALTEQDTAALTQREAAFKVQEAKGKFIAQAKRDTSQNPSDANLTAFKEDLLANPLFTEPEKALLATNVDRILAMPVNDRRAFMASQGASASDLKPSNLQVNQGGQTQVLQMPAFGGAGTSVGAYPDMPLPKAVEEQQLRLKTAGAARTNVNLPPQQNAFEGELGKGQAKSIIENRAVAQDAASIIDTVNIGRDILKGGVITGAAADFLVNFNQALKTAGVDFGYADAAANSQAYAANMAQNVGKIIKQFGAGTGLSDADRQYAEKMAGGKITLDAKALNKILDINESAARNVITRHNKDVAGIKTNIPLTVEMPAKRTAPPITAVNPSTGARIQSTDGGKTWTAVGGS